MKHTIRAKINNAIYIIDMASDSAESYGGVNASNYIGCGTYYSYDETKANDPKMTHFWGNKQKCKYYPIWDKDERSKKVMSLLKPFFKNLTKTPKPGHTGQYGYFKKGCEWPIFGLHLVSNANDDFIVNADEMWKIKNEFYLKDKEWISIIKELAKEHLELTGIDV